MNKKIRLVTNVLPFVEGALLMTILIYLIKLEGFILWLIFLAMMGALSMINVTLIYPKLINDKVKKNG